MGQLMLRTDPGRGPCVQGSARCASQWQPTAALHIAEFRAGGSWAYRLPYSAGLCPLTPATASRAGMGHVVTGGFVFEGEALVAEAGLQLCLLLHPALNVGMAGVSGI